jgi:hypothetical protein
MIFHHELQTCSNYTTKNGNRHFLIKTYVVDNHMKKCPVLTIIEEMLCSTTMVMFISYTRSKLTRAQGNRNTYALLMGV